MGVTLGASSSDSVSLGSLGAADLFPSSVEEQRGAADRVSPRSDALRTGCGSGLGVGSRGAFRPSQSPTLSVHSILEQTPVWSQSSLQSSFGVTVLILRYRDG